MYCVLYGTLVLGILLKDSSVAVWSEGARVAPERPRAGRWVDVEGGHHAIGLSPPPTTDPKPPSRVALEIKNNSPRRDV